jgi:FkbM family methyltransferase
LVELATIARNPFSVVPLLLFRRREWRSDFRVGGLTLSARRSDLVAISEVAEQGEYGFVRELTFPDNALVLDLGANIGCFAALIFSIRPDVEVHSAEPSPDTSALLLDNRRRYPHLRWHVHRTAVADVDGTLTFSNDGPSTARRLTPGRGIPVAAESFDGFVSRVAGARRVFLCKMDIEGAEVPIFAGGPRALAQIDHFVVEVHGPSVNGSMVASTLSAAFPHLEKILNRGSSKPLIHAWRGVSVSP